MLIRNIKNVTVLKVLASQNIQKIKINDREKK